MSIRRNMVELYSEMIDVQRLLLARLWVARTGERDVLNWWASDGVLGEDGAYVGPRVLPKTHATGRARIAFAVARHACDERHPDASVHHLFRLDPPTEDRFDQLLVDKLKEHEWWATIITALEKVRADVSLGDLLSAAGVIERGDIDYVMKATRGPAGRSLPLSAGGSSDQTIQRLAAGFIRSEPGALTVPYVAGNGK
jgi:hypothetical protein